MRKFYTHHSIHVQFAGLVLYTFNFSIGLLFLEYDCDS